METDTALKTVYIGLGSNVGDRAANLADARSRMEGCGIGIARASSIYETAPRDYENQPWFLNQVLEIQTNFMPRQLMAQLLRIEREMGRRRNIAKGPRTVDLDILIYGETVMQTTDLEIPHPLIAERRFVLEPLAELANDLRHPRTGITVRQMLAKVTDQPVRRWTMA